MSTSVHFNEDVQKGIFKGVKTIAEAVASTLGPAGRDAIIEQEYGEPLVTRDGVTVAKSITFKDKLENTGAMLIRGIASKTDSTAGDGTTTSTILGYSFIEKGLKYTSKGVNPILLKKGMNLAVEDVITHLKEISKPIETKEQIAQVASISANNDNEIGNLVADALESIGLNGVITTKESNTTETFTEFVEGMRFDKGFLSPYFTNDTDATKCVFNNPYILITDKSIGTIRTLAPVLQKVSSTNRPLLIIADDIENEALGSLVLNLLKGVIQVCAIKAPSFGDRKKHVLEDIAVLTGAKVISSETGVIFDDVSLDDLGECSTLTVTKDCTIIVDGMGDPELIDARVEKLKADVGEAKSSYDREWIQERIAKLDGGIALINVGAMDELTLKEKKFRIEDSINATRAASEGGILPGGGVALCQTVALLSKKKLDKLSEEERLGYRIVLEAIENPIRQIAENAGVDGSVVAEKCKKSKDGIGFNALTRKWVNMVDAGVIDPTKVTTEALKNAFSVASLILTTNCAITIDRENRMLQEAVLNTVGM